MFKSICKIALPIAALTYCFAAHAAFALNNTRYIYDDQQQNISFQVTNESNAVYRGQVWIGNGDHNPNNVYFIAAPAFFQLPAGKTQIVRLINVNHSLPQNKESLFFLNVQEIPQAIEGNKNALQIAMDTRVKLIYRPQTLQANRTNAEQKMQVIDVAGKAALKNPTPYFFAVLSVSNNGKPVTLTSKEDQDLGQFKPDSTITLNISYSSVKDFSFKAINDYGNTITYRINKA